jgi:TonB family protein
MDLIMSHQLLYVSAVALLAANVSAPVSANEISQHLSTIIVPEPIKRIEPKYPVSAARQSREGWAIFSFVINEEGSVEDIILKDSSGSKDITKAAKKAIKKWHYKPAMENGKAIQQCVNTVKLDFRMHGSSTKGVSRKFKKKYDKAVEALNTKDFARFEELLVQMNNSKYMHLSENNYLQLLLAQYAKEMGDKRKQLHHLRRIANSLESVNEAQQFSVLYQVFNLQVELSQFVEAHATYEKLIELPSATPYFEQFSEVIAKVESIISSDKNIVITADIEKDYWSADLVRNEFSLTNIEGSLHTLDVRCANKRHVYTVENNNTWRIPSSWKNCSIYVYGEPKTSFNLIEHPVDI